MRAGGARRRRAAAPALPCPAARPAAVRAGREEEIDDGAMHFRHMRSCMESSIIGWPGRPGWLARTRRPELEQRTNVKAGLAVSSARVPAAERPVRACLPVHVAPLDGAGAVSVLQIHGSGLLPSVAGRLWACTGLERGRGAAQRRAGARQLVT